VSVGVGEADVASWRPALWRKSILYLAMRFLLFAILCAILYITILFWNL
jgi:hypothetical protein